MLLCKAISLSENDFAESTVCGYGRIVKAPSSNIYDLPLCHVLCCSGCKIAPPRRKHAGTFWRYCQVDFSMMALALHLKIREEVESVSFGNKKLIITKWQIDRTTWWVGSVRYKAAVPALLELQIIG